MNRQRVQALGDSHRNLAKRAIGWVRFLDRNVKQMKKHAWSHPLFARAAGNLLATFCASAGQALEADPAQASAQLSGLAPVLSERLDACVKAQGGRS
jgi:hypothetical protein